MTLKHFAALPILCAAFFSTTAYADTVYTSASSFAAATSGTTTVGFGTTIYSGGYTSLATPTSSGTVGSVTVTSNTPTTFVNITNDSYYTPTYPDGNYINIAGGTSGVNDILTFVFPSSTAFSINLGGIFGSGESFTYTLGDGTQGTFVASGYLTSGGALDFLGFTTNTAINSITISSTNGSDVAAYDNVTYGQALSPVPEPSSLAFFSTGVLGFAGVLRRRYLLSNSRS